MGRLAEEMIRLKSEVDQSRQDRKIFVQQIKTARTRLSSDVGKLTDRFAKERQQRYTQVKNELSSFRAGMIGCVDDLSQDVSRMIEQFHLEMDTIRQERAQRSHDIGRIRKQVFDQLKISRRERLKQADELRKNLRTFRAKMTEQVKDISQKDRSQRTAYITEFKKEVSHMMGSFRKDLMEQARGGQEDRAAYLFGIKESVDEMMQDMHQFRSGIVSDLATIREVWQGRDTEPPSDSKASNISVGDQWNDPQGGHSDDKTGEKSSDNSDKEIRQDPVLESVSNAEKVSLPAVNTSSGIHDPDFSKAPVIQETPPPLYTGGTDEAVDDLTLISGIGPGRDQQLKKLGVYSFAQLAGCDPDTLYEELKRQVGLPSIIHWIEQAKELNF